MRRFALMIDTAEVKTRKPVEECTAQDLFDAYMDDVDTCAKRVSTHNSIVKASEALFSLNLNQTWAISLHRAQVNVAYIQEVDLYDDDCADFGDICAAIIGERTGC